jgi:hypothetical protein
VGHQVWFEEFIKPKKGKKEDEKSRSARRGCLARDLTIVRSKEMATHVSVGTSVRRIHPRVALIAKVLTHIRLLSKIFGELNQTLN